MLRTSKIRFLSYPLLTLVVLLIGFNGYINPVQLRSFGDISPNTPVGVETGFEFYRTNFLETYQPNFYAPYRYQIEKFSTQLSQKGVSKLTIDWLFLFFPFLISLYLTFFFFRSIAKTNSGAFFVWFVYAFSTFVLFTSSIHTPILTGINLMLFFLFLWDWYLNSSQRWTDFLLYTCGSATILVIASIFELRMLIVTAPFFIAVFAVLLLKTPVTFSKLWRYGLVHVLILIIYIGNFYYLITNLNSILSTVSLATTRSTWGSEYFSLINALSLSHPFWNNAEAVNFIYNFPHPVHLLYLVGTGLIFLLITMNGRRHHSYIIMSVSLLFFLFLSKQNGAPIENIYERLYSHPYFSFSREASKYFYGYILSLLVLLGLVLRQYHFEMNEQVFSKKKMLIFLILIVSFLLPTLNNFYIFSSGMFGNSTREYKYDTAVYSKINTFIQHQSSSSDTEIRALWIPLLGTLQDDTDHVRHMSYSVLQTIYPLSDIRREPRTYLYESLRDKNLKDYLALMGFKYIVIPNLKNEPSIASQIQLQYPDFDYESFVEYVTTELSLELVANIDGYQIYQNHASDPLLVVGDNIVNQNYGAIGMLEPVNNYIANFLPSASSTDFEIQPSNCNANAFQRLDFVAKDRISVITNKGQVVLDMWARMNEIPCVFISVKDASSSNLFLSINSYSGDPTEVVIFGKSFPQKIYAEKILNLTSQSSGQIPIDCPSFPCTFALYLQGTSRITTKQVKTSFTVVNAVNIKSITESSDVILDRTPINSLKNTIIKVTPQIAESDYILFPYDFDKDYRLLMGNESLAPIDNNHHLLLFNISKFQTKLLPGENLNLRYNKELSISKDLHITDLINLFTLAAFLLSFTLWSLIFFRKSKRN